MKILELDNIKFYQLLEIMLEKTLVLIYLINLEFLL